MFLWYWWTSVIMHLHHLVTEQFFCDYWWVISYSRISNKKCVSLSADDPVHVFQTCFTRKYNLKFMCININLWSLFIITCTMRFTMFLQLLRQLTSSWTPVKWVSVFSVQNFFSEYILHIQYNKFKCPSTLNAKGSNQCGTWRVTVIKLHITWWK